MASMMPDSKQGNQAASHAGSAGLASTWRQDSKADSSRGSQAGTARCKQSGNSPSQRSSRVAFKLRALAITGGGSAGQTLLAAISWDARQDPQL